MSTVITYGTKSILLNCYNTVWRGFGLDEQAQMTPRHSAGISMIQEPLLAGCLHTVTIFLMVRVQ